MTTWEHASSKLGAVSPKCRLIAREVFDAAQSAGHDVWFLWGDGSTPDHVYNRQGRPVLDFMVKTKAAGDWVRNYIWENRHRLGLKHVIWAQHITSTTVQPGMKRKMADRGNPTANHFDHNHAEWFAGEYVPLKAETGEDFLMALSNAEQKELVEAAQIIIWNLKGWQLMDISESRNANEADEKRDQADAERDKSIAGMLNTIHQKLEKLQADVDTLKGVSK